MPASRQLPRSGRLIGRRIQPKGSQGTIGEAAVLLLSASPLLGYRRDLVNSGVLKSVSTRPKRNTLLLVVPEHLLALSRARKNAFRQSGRAPRFRKVSDGNRIRTSLDPRCTFRARPAVQLR